MTREWITDFNKMGFTEEEKELALKVFNADPSSTLYFDGDKNYLWEDEREDNYFTKETLLENLAITFEEWKKEGMFDEEDEAPANPWLKVLENRIAEEDEKFRACMESIREGVANLKEWLNMTDDYEIACDIDFRASEIVGLKNCLEEINHRRHAARGELADYKKIMNH